MVHTAGMRKLDASAFRVSSGRSEPRDGGGHDRGCWWLGGILFFIIWVAIAFWPARVASRKGHSFIGYFVLSLFFFPLALILAYVVHDRRAQALA